MPKVEKIGQVFKCEICGNVVEIKAVGGGELICCGQPMVLINQEAK
jgi:desulfoferrodoxin-like iron-binding protein